MKKHYVLTLNPTAQFEWERCVLQHPMTAEQPDFADLIAASVSESAHEDMPQRSGSYLIAVKLEVTILESNITNSITDEMAESIPDSFPSSMKIPVLESNRVVRSIPDRITPDRIAEVA